MRVLDRNNAETLEQAAPRRNERIVAVEATALGLVVLLGLGVRLLGLTAYGIWFDEGYHVALVRLPTVGAMLEAVLSNPPSDPLYVLVLRGWVGLFGHGDTEVRLLSVLLSTATLPAAYWLGRVMAGGAVGLLGALLFAVSPYAVELGQEAALYTLAALATTAALAAGWRLRTTGRGAGLYVLLAVVAIYSHYVVAVILALFALLPPVLAPRHPVESSIFKTSPSREAKGRYSESRWAAAHALVFIAWLPWLLALGAHLMTTSLPRVALAHRATWLDVQDALMQYTAGTAARQAQ